MTLPRPRSRSRSRHPRPARAGRPDIIVVGASAGGLAPLKALLAGLPRDLAAAVFVVVHIPERMPSRLPTILDLAGPFSSLPLIGRGKRIAYGNVYVASPGHYLRIHRRLVRNERTKKIGLHRPSVDALFRSAAAAFGRRVIGIVLSGYLSDGSSGLQEIQRCGGTTIVQDPIDAQCGDMPTNAISRSSPDYCVPAAELAELVCRLVKNSA